MKELVKLAIILAIICCGAAVSLGYVYKLTKGPIAEQQRKKKARAIEAVFPQLQGAEGREMDERQVCEESGDAACRQLYILKTGAGTAGVAMEAVASGYGGAIDIMIGVLPDGTLSGIKIVSHTETPGLGANITKEAFYTQFRQKNLDNTNWTLKKNGGDIDQVSGASISSTAVMKAVNKHLRFFNENRQTILSAQSDT